ncbi:hypothetical protein C7450_11173 [Chelatococcus asaccharovorans]|uniref:Uncharacterized protein n=1 Tax=Chelatococcus asaccharovorans TaxID=28210 RepID=A0A2V3TYF3_9HYPH|nr:hypothetical protein C7450_11173 [Chelatococcus asaccharovorans]
MWCDLAGEAMVLRVRRDLASGGASARRAREALSTGMVKNVARPTIVAIER